MKIQEVSLGYLSLPLVTPFKTALRTVNSIYDLIVRVTLDTGETGYGEAPPTAVITGETKTSIAAAIREYLAPAVRGMSFDRPGEVWERMDKALAKNTSAKAAMDIAVHDAWARAEGKPLFRLLSPDGQVKTELETDLTISLNDAERRMGQTSTHRPHRMQGCER